MNNNFIDLGLPSGTKWADCNLGATKPEEYGDYFMWASAKPNTKDKCCWENTPYHSGPIGGSRWIKYNVINRYGVVDNKDMLDEEDDAAYIATNGKCRIPTGDECEELLDYTTNEWVQLNGVNGRKFTSKKNGNSIFIPTSGFQLDHTVCAHTFWGFIWSSTLNTKHPHLVSYLKFYSDDCRVSSTCRSAGFPIRPVSK